MGEDLDGGEIGANYLLLCHPHQTSPVEGEDNGASSSSGASRGI